MIFGKSRKRFIFEQHFRPKDNFQQKKRSEKSPLGRQTNLESGSQKKRLMDRFFFVGDGEFLQRVLWTKITKKRGCLKRPPNGGGAAFF